MYDEQKERNDMIVENMNLVHHIAHKMYLSPYAYYSYEDIVQEGMIGLIKAADNFNPDLGFAFSTYAVPQIQGYMMRFIRDNQRRIKYSRKDIDAYAKIQRTGKSIHELTPADLEELEITQKQLAAVISMMSESSLNDQVFTNKDGDEISLMDMVSSPNSNELSDEYYESQIELIKNEALKKFSKVDSCDLIDEWYYSQIIGIPAGQVYLGSKYKFSQVSVSRIISKFKHEMLLLLKKYGYEVSEYLKE